MSADLLVADSGPLIALARLDLHGLPARYFESVIVTSTVWTEVTRMPRYGEAPRLASALSSGFLVIRPDPQNMPEALMTESIDAGERSAIALAIEMLASVMIDERRGRRVARGLGRPVFGTFALLVRAREDGHIAMLRPLIEQLQTTNYYLPHDEINKVLVRMGE